MTGANETSRDLALGVQLVERQLARKGVVVVGRVRESHNAFDLALENVSGVSVVVRCADEPSGSNFSALRTMIAEGDFDRAFIVHTGSETDLTSEIQTWPVSRIDELAALLANEKPNP